MLDGILPGRAGSPYGKVVFPAGTGSSVGVADGSVSAGPPIWLSSVKVGVLVFGVVSSGGVGSTAPGGKPDGAPCLVWVWIGLKHNGFLRSSLKYARSTLMLSMMSPNDMVQSSAVVGTYHGTLMTWYPNWILCLKPLLRSASRWWM